MATKFVTKNARGFGWSIWYKVTTVLHVPVYDGFDTKRDAQGYMRQGEEHTRARLGAAEMVRTIATGRSPRHGWSPSKALIKACKVVAS
jgi:hypothetical protein